MDYHNNRCEGEFDYYIPLSRPVRRRVDYEWWKVYFIFVERM